MKKVRIPISDANILYFIISVLVVFVGIPISIIFSISYGQETFVERIFDLVNQVMFVLFPILIYLACRVEDFDIKSILRLKPISFFNALLVVFIAICTHYIASFLNMVIMFFMVFFSQVPNINIAPVANVSQFILSIVMFALLPAICEELLHRGILLNAYERRGTKRAIIISAILFGIFHYDVKMLFSPILFGLVAGYMVVKTDSICAGIIAHFVYNALSELILFLQKGYVRESMFVNVEEILLAIPSVILTLVFLFISLKLFSNNSDSKFFEPIASVRQDITSVLSHWPLVLSLVMYISISIMFVITQSVLY